MLLIPVNNLIMVMMVNPPYLYHLTALMFTQFSLHSLALRVHTIQFAQLLLNAVIFRFCFRVQLICILAKICSVICLFLYTDVCIPQFRSKQPLYVTLYTYMNLKTFMTVITRVNISRIHKLACCYCCKHH